MPRWTGKWAGGRTYRTKDGHTVFLLRRMVAGKRYQIVLESKNERDANAELGLFLRDPERYQTRAVATAEHNAPGAAVRITEDLVKQFEAYLTAEKLTARYVRNVKHYLMRWVEALGERDFRAVTLQEVQQELGRHSRGRKHRITALKALTKWLREKKAVLMTGEDCTLALKVPVAKPERARRAALGQVKGYSIRDIERVYAAIDPWVSTRPGWKTKNPDVQSVRDVLCIKAKTGMHFEELVRLAKGEGTLRLLEDQGEIAGTITFIHKSDAVHIQSIDRQTVAAVQRLQARKGAPVDSYLRKVLKRATESLGMKPVNLGELRHSFVTWMREGGEEIRPRAGGVPLEAIAAAIGHRSTRTTSRFYDSTQIPPMLRAPIKLEHPDDPVPIQAGKRTGKG